MVLAEMRGAQTMNKYVAFYKGKQKVIEAATSLAAQTAAARLFGAKKQYEVTVVLTEKDGAAVVHGTNEL